MDNDNNNNDGVGSVCGVLFDQYVREVLNEPSAHSLEDGPNTKDFHNLWPGRRLKIKFSKDCHWWVHGRVAIFTLAYSGPASPSTRWYMTIQMEKNTEDEFQLGQLVKIHGLQSAKGQQLNGKYGVVTAFKNKEGRYPVQLFSASDTPICVKPENLSAILEFKREICHINISGGGILFGREAEESTDKSNNNLSDKISFEWLDKAEPYWEPNMSPIQEMEDRLAATSETNINELVLSGMYHDIAFALFKMGLLAKAFQVFLNGTAHWDRRRCPQLHKGYDELLETLKKFTGTSGYFLSEDGCHRIDADVMSNVASLEPHLEAPVHFGDVSGKERWEPVNVSLPRPLALRTLPSSCSTFDDKVAEQVFMEIYNGYFDAETLIGSGDELGFGGPPGEKICVMIVYAQSSSKRVMMVHLKSIPNPRGNNRQIEIHLNCEEPYRSMFTKTQKSALNNRVIHWFLRHCGVKLDATIEVSELCECLRKKYVSSSNWKDAIDASVIDVDFRARNGQGLFSSLNNVGEALEASKKFDVAARVYSESAQLAISQQEYSLASSLFCNSGLAYKRCNNFAQAEDQYVASLHFKWKSKMNGLNINDDGYDNVITNMITNYETWIIELKKAARLDSEANQVENVYVTLSCLLYRSGFQARQGGLTGRAVKTYGKKMSSLALKSTYTSKSQCMSALKNAISSSTDASGFRSRVLECRHESVVVSIHPNGNISRDGKSEKKNARKQILESSPSDFASTKRCDNEECGRFILQDAIQECLCGKAWYCSEGCRRIHWNQKHRRECTTKEKNKIKQMTNSTAYCSNCLKMERDGDDNIKLLQCPCHTVKYCSKACQREDWPEHKQVCPNKRQPKQK